MKTNKELIQLLIDNIDLLSTGLCKLAQDLYWNDVITYTEAVRLLEIIRFNPEYYDYENDSLYYFIPGNKPERIEYLKKIIKKYQ